MPMIDPATQRRRFIRLLIVVAFVLLVGGGLYTLYQVNSGKQNVVSDEATLTKARQAFADDDYELVVSLLENPANNNATRSSVQEDPELLHMYVTARKDLPMYKNRHLSRIVTPLILLLQLEPNEIESGRTLVDALLTLERNDDALKHAKKLVDLHPDDTALIRYLAQAQQRKGNAQASFESLQRAIQIEPLHVLTHAQMLDLTQQYGLPTEPFITQAKQVYADHANDTRAMMIRAMALQFEGNGVQARELLKQASALAPANQEMVPLLTQWLDRSGMYADATRYLMQHAEQGTQTPAGRMAIYRAFKANDHATILARLQDSDPTQANTDLLGMWADAHRQAGSLDQADALLDELKERDNAIASTWLMLIGLDPQAQPAQVIDPIITLLTSKDNPVGQSRAKRHQYFMQRLGQAYLQAQEPEGAYAAFSVAVSNSDSWARPHLSLAQTLIQLGQYKPALAHAREAQIRDDIAEARQWLVLAMAGAADPSDPAAVDRVLYEADKIPAPSPQAEQVLPNTIDLLARANRHDEAKQRLTAALGDNEALSAETLNSLMRVSLTHGLGLDSTLADKSESLHGMTPGLALIKALAKAEAEGFDQGLPIIEQATPSPTTKPWQMAMADYLTAQQQATAASLRIELAEQYPDDLSLQLAALKANSPEGQEDRFTKLIAHLRDLAGDASINWRLQQARVGMRDADDEKTLRETAELLSEAEALSPVHHELRMALSRCFMMLGDNHAALERAQAAKSIAPDNPQVMLLHGMALHRLNRYPESRIDLIPLATNTKVDPATRHQACVMLNEQGENRTVRQAIEQMWSVGQANNPALIILARIYKTEGLFEKADQVCQQLMQSPDAATVRFVSTYYHQTDRPDLAEQAILAAQAVGINEADRLMLLADDATQSGKFEDALALIEQAARLESDQPHRWHKAAQLALSVAKPDDAIRLAKLGLESVSDDAGLTSLVQHASLMQQIKDDQSLIPMAVTILNRQAHHEQAVRALQITHQSKQSEEAAIALAELASKHPGFKYLSELACDRLMRAGLDERAYPLAKSAMARFPDSGATARVATLVAFRLQDWSMLLNAANAWADRTPRDRGNADLMRAAAMNKLDRFGTAIKTLQPYVRAQTQISANNQLIFEYYTHALVRNGESVTALKTLRPHLSTSSHARSIALKRVTEDLAQPDAIEAWLKEVTASSSDEAQDRFAIATALFLSGQRLNNESLIRQADQAITSLPDAQGPLQLDIQYAQGQIAHRLGDNDRARAIYRQVLKKVPNNPQVLNNLALVLAEGDSDALAEAEQFATRATQLASKDPNLLDTLAIVHLRRGQHDQALTAIDEAIDLNSSDPAWHMTKSDILEAMGETDRAALIREKYAPLLQN